MSKAAQAVADAVRELQRKRRRTVTEDERDGSVPDGHGEDVTDALLESAQGEQRGETMATTTKAKTAKKTTAKKTAGTKAKATKSGAAKATKPRAPKADSGARPTRPSHSVGNRSAKDLKLAENGIRTEEKNRYINLYFEDGFVVRLQPANLDQEETLKCRDLMVAWLASLV